MALVKNTLKSKIEDALQAARDGNWNFSQVAEAWANAIHDYVKEAEVEGVQSNVTVSVPLNVPTPSQGSGTATQTGRVKIK